MTDTMTQEGIRALLPEELNSCLRIEILDSATSTNDYVKQLSSKDGYSYHVVIADEQTAGKGRRGKVFFSPKGCGVYLSIKIDEPDAEAWFVQGDLSDRHVQYTQSLTALAALAVCRSIEQNTNKEAKIKWPNDVYCEGKKVCGILCESQIEAYSGKVAAYIAGIGINVYESRELDKNAQNGGYLANNIEQGLRNKLAASLIQEFATLREWGIEEARDAYRHRSMLINQSIIIEYDDSRSVPAHVEDIDNNFQLIVRYQDGIQDTLEIANYSIKL